MGKLRDQMLMEMQLRNYKPKTIEAYIGHMVGYTKLFGKSPAQMGEQEIRKYLYHLKTEKKTSYSNINIAYCALRFFYTKVLDRRWNVDKIPRQKTEKKLPVVLSQQEVQKLFNVTSNLKHRVILMTAYSAGLRVGETTRLKIQDIDSHRMQIRVEKGKGAKDRYTLLSDALLPELREYYRVYRPQTWLFPGKTADKPISPDTLQTIFKRAKKKPASEKRRRFTPCGIVLPRTCWKQASIFSP
jgi:integrase